MAPLYLEEAWEVTKPIKHSDALLYRNALSAVLSLPPQKRYRSIFRVEKKNGGHRTIYPAGRDLRLVQTVLSAWLVREFPMGDDFCYLKRTGALGAVQKHLSSRYALVCDLKGAFEHVTDERITHQISLYRRSWSAEVVHTITDLLVYDGRVRQGCVSSPYAYNFVIFPLDQQFTLSPGSSLAYTRYSDNICFSSPKPIDWYALELQIGRMVRANGFELSWKRRYETDIEYLGTVIGEGKLTLAEEKYGEFFDRTLEAIASPTPAIYLPEIRGIYQWSHHVCGDHIPEDLLLLFARYFRKVRRIPESLVGILARRQTGNMF